MERIYIFEEIASDLKKDLFKGISINSSLLGFVQSAASRGNDDEAYKDIG